MPAKPAAATAEPIITMVPSHLQLPAYVKGSHAAGIRADHDARRTALLARQEVAMAERERLDEELADIDLALKLCSEPDLASNVTTLRLAE